MADIHLIGNAHLDPVWLWRWQDGYKEAHATFRSALDRMYDFPDFKFTSACAVYYQWIEKLDPGTRVFHPMFGEGVITYTRDYGADVCYEVKFDTGVTKKLMATYAKLKKI